MAQPAQALTPGLATAPVPPQNLDAEESVLGAMMLSPGAIGAVSEILDAGDFYRETHATIYRAALGLYAKGEPVDAITLVDELDRLSKLADVGGQERVHELAALVPATSNAAHYARIVHEMATLRGLIRAGNDIARLGFDRPGETIDLVDRAEQIVFELSQQRVSSEFAHIDSLLKDSFERITALYEAGSETTGTATGFKGLDRITSGFQPGNLIIVAARPSMGKSALALGMAANIAVRDEKPVALFTLEMSKSEVTQRFMCSEGKVESQRLRTGKLAADDWPRLTAACDKLSKAPIYVDDTGSITMMEIRSKLRRLKSQCPDLGLVIVDYLQLMTSGTNVENRVQEVSQISRSLKVLARDLEVPILALSQLSRAVEQRHDKRPILSDLRESGSIEQDADVVMFVYRDEYYNPEDTESAGIAELHRREAPQRPHRHDEARVPEAVREVRRPGGRLMETAEHDNTSGSRRAPPRYSCLCEHCLERARVEGRSLFDAMHEASVRGSIAGRQRRRVRALPGWARDRDPPRRAAARPDPPRPGAAADSHDRTAARLARARGDDLPRALRGVPRRRSAR